MKILIADDDRVFVELLSGRFRAKGFDVSVAFDAAQAMMAAMKSKPDVAVLDVRMPGGNGIDTLAKLKLSTKTGMIPVIVVTALEDDQIEETAREAGAAWFIRKPAKFEQVHGAVSAVLGLTTHGASA
jgi:DNA-binding response OmpR family regulator